MSFSVNFCRRSLRSIKVGFRLLQHCDNTASLNSVTGLKTPSQQFFLKRVSFTMGVKLCATIVNGTSCGLYLSTENQKSLKEEKIFTYFSFPKSDPKSWNCTSAAIKFHTHSDQFFKMSVFTLRNTYLIKIGLARLISKK